MSTSETALNRAYECGRLVAHEDMVARFKKESGKAYENEKPVEAELLMRFAKTLETEARAERAEWDRKYGRVVKRGGD